MKQKWNRFAAAWLILALLLQLSGVSLPVFAEKADVAEASPVFQDDETKEPEIWDGTVADSFDSGTGTEQDPYIIRTPQQLAYFSQCVNYGTNFEGQFLRLDADIVLNDTSNWTLWGTNNNDENLIEPDNIWIPIGTSWESKFSGNLDGSDHFVKGIYICSSEDYQGLFGYCYNSTIQNLTVSESSIAGSYAVGSIAGYSNATIKNCQNSGNVSGTSQVGGIAGRVQHSVIDCNNIGTVTGSVESTGGVAGYLYGIIRNCFNIGIVNGVENSGGVVGYVEKTNSERFENCFNTGSVTGKRNTGGIAGCVDKGSVIENCYNSGDVKGTTRTGGIAGHLSTKSFIQVSNNTGAVTGIDFSTGGIAGAITESNVVNCYNKGTITGRKSTGGVAGNDDRGLISCCYNGGIVIGNDSGTGGVAGSLYSNTFYGNSDEHYGYVKMCFNIGSVMGRNKTGGIAGEVSSEHVVQLCYNTAVVDGYNEVGGVAGEVSGGRSIVRYCYNIGSVYKNGNNIGGIAGRVMLEGVVEKCYYLNSCVYYGNEYGTSLQESQMQLKESYPEYNFTYDWTMNGNSEYSYPEIVKNNHIFCEHIFNDWSELNSASCTKNGILFRECTWCGKSEYEVIPVLGHNLVYHVAKAPTCTEIGWYAYQSCTRCDYTTYAEVLALGHDTVDYAAQAPTCAEIGWNAYQTCTRCDYTTFAELPALGHDLVEHKAKAPTCTANGWNAYQTCTRCDYTTYAEVPALGHDLIDHAAKAPTCTAVGWDAYQTCSRCDYTNYTELPALGHELIDHAAKAPTCTAVGWNAYQSCTRCDYITFAELPALGHDLVDHAAKAPTCTAIGWNAYQSCKRCDYTTYTELPALGHDLIDHEAKAPTCTEIGWEAYQTCAYCDYSTYVELPALEHRFENGVCTVCGAKDPDYKPTVSFVDVPEEAFYYNAVLWAVAHEPQVTAGTDATHFSPNSACTRGQVVTFLWRANGCPEPKSTTHPFTDVKESGFYYKAMLWAVENGITTGASKTTFAPGKPCTRGQVVTFLWRAKGSPAPKSTAHPFTDVNESGYYFKAMLWAVENGVTTGASKTTFAPDKSCTRGQVVTFLYRAEGGK